MSFAYDDIEPVTLNEQDPQLCRILYTDEYKQTMGLLLALMQKQEYSQRALAMTELGIELLASHYSTWIYRYNIITHLDKDLYEELDWLESIALENEKNYQIWNYRQLIIKQILKQAKESYNVNREFPIITAMLGEDSKNHHVWSYRRWLVSQFNLFDDEKELELTTNMIKGDIRNNSAWNHRFFLKFGGGVTSSDTIDLELEFVKHFIVLSPQNESTWNYLLGIYHKFNIDLTTLEPFCKHFVDESALEASDVDKNEIDLIKSSFALEVLAKIYKDERALKIYDLLIEKYDPIRVNYWNYMKSVV